MAAIWRIMKKIIHGVEVDTNSKQMKFNGITFDEMDVYRLGIAIKVSQLFEYLKEIYSDSSTDEELFEIACEVREILVTVDAALSDDEAIAVACNNLGIELVGEKGSIVDFDNRVISSVS